MTTQLDQICAGRSTRFKLPTLDWRGTPLGVDVRQGRRAGHHAEGHHRDPPRVRRLGPGRRRAWPPRRSSASRPRCWRSTVPPPESARRRGGLVAACRPALPGPGPRRVPPRRLPPGRGLRAGGRHGRRPSRPAPPPGARAARGARRRRGPTSTSRWRRGGVRRRWTPAPSLAAAPGAGRSARPGRALGARPVTARPPRSAWPWPRRPRGRRRSIWAAAVTGSPPPATTRWPGSCSCWPPPVGIARTWRASVARARTHAISLAFLRVGGPGPGRRTGPRSAGGGGRAMTAAPSPATRPGWRASARPRASTSSSACGSAWPRQRTFRSPDRHVSNRLTSTALRLRRAAARARWPWSACRPGCASDGAGRCGSAAHRPR